MQVKILLWLMCHQCYTAVFKEGKLISTMKQIHPKTITMGIKHNLFPNLVTSFSQKGFMTHGGLKWGLILWPVELVWQGSKVSKCRSFYCIVCTKCILVTAWRVLKLGLRLIYTQQYAMRQLNLAENNSKIVNNRLLISRLERIL